MVSSIFNKLLTFKARGSSVAFYVILCSAGVIFAAKGRADGTNNSYAFKVESVLGKISYRYPFQPGWKDVTEERILHPGAMIQVADDSSLIMSIMRKGKPSRDENYAIIIDTPILCRLNLANLKQFTSRILKVSALQALLGGGGTKKADIKKYYIKHAWTRWKVQMDGFQSAAKKEEELDKKKKKTPHKQIDVIFPEKKLTKMMVKSQSRMDILWDTPKSASNQNFKVYVWKKGQKPSTPSFITDKNHLSLPITESGTYNFQIESLDGKFKSATQQMTFRPPSFKELSSADKEQSLVIHFPTSDAKILTNQATFEFPIVFTDTLTPYLSKCSYTLDIRGLDHSFSKKVTFCSPKQAITPLNHGSYKLTLTNNLSGIKKSLKFEIASNARWLRETQRLFAKWKKEPSRQQIVLTDP